MYDQIISAIMEIVITGCVIFVTKCIIPWLKSKTYYEQITNAIEVAQNFVVYAEELITGEKKGAERFEYVTELLIPVIKKMKLECTDDQIKSIVQTAYQLAIGDSESL